MTSRAKAAVRPFAGSPGADEEAGGLAPFLEANRLALGHWTKVSDAMVKGIFVVSQEMTQFAQTRLNEDVKNYEALSRCHSPSEALDCQHRFAETATAQYLEEANKLTGLMTSIANAGYAFLQHPEPEKGRTTQPKPV
ncbi:MAG: hypothetical protein QOK29_3895 [Rhodospirillaceae bacterium]|jgi:hypothetical protein|nr:hypothetical protein [Rhodospirillaceae bacterium]